MTVINTDVFIVYSNAKWEFIDDENENVAFKLLLLICFNINTIAAVYTYTTVNIVTDKWMMRNAFKFEFYISRLEQIYLEFSNLREK